MSRSRGSLHFTPNLTFPNSWANQTFWLVQGTGHMVNNNGIGENL